MAASPFSRQRFALAFSLAAAVGFPLACMTPPPQSADPGASASPPAALAAEPISGLDAWSAAARMSPGTNIGNTLENTTTWETGWGNPRITRGYVQALARLGFRTVRLPVAWDTYAVNGQIQPGKLARVAEVVDWILGAGMFCVINIHWDGGWIDSDDKAKFPDTYATFSPAAEQKFRAYWTQISSYFASRDERLLFESLNEETKFEGAGSEQQAYDTLTHVNQLFIDTVRATGGNNAHRLLVVAGYATDITKTCSAGYSLPKDRVPHKLFISVHYYTPWPFVGMTEDASWGKMAQTWGSPADVSELNRLFDTMARFCESNDIPAFIGEYNVTEKKEAESRVRWLSAVSHAAHSRKMVPVLWDTGGEVSRNPPYAPSAVLTRVLPSMR